MLGTTFIEILCAFFPGGRFRVIRMLPDTSLLHTLLFKCIEKLAKCETFVSNMNTMVHNQLWRIVGCRIAGSHSEYLVTGTLRGFPENDEEEKDFGSPRFTER
ncbi:hypothetical protein AVEN_201672-1 [Araneus ventricosus]|uniref:Uncharacterized protein n=1 Tax=Araneus ventricosus TaxID=182803 RepID=A0A4Y2QHS5_ARAVE|nr:hypothetical protein AVEN_201672-1 [Araneus ventricosus]